MYEFFTGNLDYIGEDYIALDVNGVGYKIHTSTLNMNKCRLGNSYKFYTHLHVREDDLVLFGFLSREELRMYKLLNSVNGVGPKAALSIMSTYSIYDIGKLLISKNHTMLTKAAGIGKKLAERIVLELKDKLSTEEVIGMGYAHTNEDISAEHISMEINQLASLNTDDDQVKEAHEALMALGYSTSEALAMINGIEAKGLNSGDIIKLALKNSGKGGRF